jgi:glucose uptake protein GlcU
MTPKDIIFDAIKTRFAESGVTKLILNFEINSDTYKVFLTNEKNEKLNVTIEPKEVTMIKMLFINKIKKKYNRENKIPLKNLIVQIDFGIDLFEIFTENEKGITTKFEY